MKTLVYGVIVLTAVLLICSASAEYCAAQNLPVVEKQNQQKPTPSQLEKNRQLWPAPKAGSSPPGPVHCLAEWEESEGILTLWKNADLMNKLQQNHLVYIPVDNRQEETWWKNFLTTNGIPLTNFQFLLIKTNSMYTRDYGPWFIWDANNEMGIVNYTCNYGYWDDLFPLNFSNLYGINYYESGLYHVGGNYLPNAYGRAFSSTHVYEANPLKTKLEVDTLMEDYYGINPYHTVAPKGIWHHDTWGKPCNPETIIVAKFPKHDRIHLAQCEGMVDYYSSLESPWGRPYKIHRLPMFPDTPGGWYYRPYQNTLVSNKHVYVPIHNCPDDQVALQVFKDAFVGYEVVGVDALTCGWPDALHCRTRNFMKRNVIRMYPYPPGDSEGAFMGHPVTAEVIPPNGSNLLAGYPLIRWTDTGGAPFNDVVMAPTGNPNEYAAPIPAQPQGTTISFYIEAKDDGGLSAIYPLVAPKGMMTFQVRADTEAPVLSRHVPLRSTAAAQWPPQVRTLCKDDMATPEVRVQYSINSVPQQDAALTREELCYFYSGNLVGSAFAGDVIAYRLTATDNAASPNTDSIPAFGHYYCPVSGPGSVAVVNLCTRPYTAPFLLDALGDLGIPHQFYGSWPTDWNEHDIWLICLGVFADNCVLTADQADDIVAALQSGKSVYLEGGNTWCNDPAKDILKPWFGVAEKQGAKGMSKAEGVPGAIMDGLFLNYWTEDLQMDVIGAVRPATAVFFSHPNSFRAVMHDEGTYRTIASTFALGGLMDKAWPNTRKEILARYLEFLGVDPIRLITNTEAIPREKVPVRITGNPGDKFLLAASLAEHYLPMTYGILRLDPSYLMFLPQGVIPASGVAEVVVQMPDQDTLVGLEIHFQALVGEDLVPGKAELTNRDIITIVE